MTPAAFPSVMKNGQGLIVNKRHLSVKDGKSASLMLPDQTSAGDFSRENTAEPAQIEVDV